MHEFFSIKIYHGQHKTCILSAWRPWRYAYNGLRFVLSISPVILDRVPSRPNDGPQAGDQAQAVGGGRRPPARPAPAI